ncbi:MAG: YbjN domain-containing protein [Spirochaetes bacterium]|jgi:hypothetical protein|nr:YbjN domain-containing protein [Brevinematales bacterium]MCL1959278.1 YbjN domain-containing protein [Spirochaetota bacterium]
MQIKKLSVFVAFILVCIANLNAQMSKQELQNMYISFLKDQGYQSNVDSDGDVEFKAEGRTFYIIVDTRDLQSFRILYPNFWEIESEDEKAKAVKVANYINRTTKVAKVYLNSREDDVSMDANIFIDKPENFKTFFRRMIDLLLEERREFREKMNE